MPKLKGTKVHKKKDPALRKKSTNPYILYSKTVRAAVTKEHPE